METKENPVKRESRRIRREKNTITDMLRIYCRAHHGGHDESPNKLCAECEDMLAYAHRRLQHCRYGASKPTCGNCPVHCYKPDMKERVMKVMAYSGPRMTYKHPYFAFMHLVDSFRGSTTLDKRGQGPQHKKD